MKVILPPRECQGPDSVGLAPPRQSISHKPLSFTQAAFIPDTVSFLFRFCNSRRFRPLLGAISNRGCRGARTTPISQPNSQSESMGQMSVMAIDVNDQA
jgi:hypothetical protein